MSKTVEVLAILAIIVIAFMPWYVALMHRHLDGIESKLRRIADELHRMNERK